MAAVQLPCGPCAGASDLSVWLLRGVCGVCARALEKLRGCIGVGCENCEGIWSIFGGFAPIYPRTFIWGAYPPAVFELRRRNL